MDAATPSFQGLTEAFAAALGKDELSPEEAAFAAQVAADLDEDEVPELEPADIGAVLATAWRAAERRSGDEIIVRLDQATGDDGRPLPVDLLEIVQNDAPFLVDSVMGELSSLGLEVRAMAHPVLQVGRSAEGVRDQAGRARRESMILVLLSPVGEDRRAHVIGAVEETLADVHAAVDDFVPMTTLMRQAIVELGGASAPPQRYGLDEHLAFLRWLTADRFVFLGARVYTYPRDEQGRYLREEPAFDPSAGLGVLRDPTRSVLRRASEPAILAEDPNAYLTTAPAVVVAKSNLRSRIHRRAHMDYIGVRRYDVSGRPLGEIRFLGLFTAETYEEPVRELPIVRRKVEQVIARAGKFPSEHAERRLRHIVETYPRDELFQIEEDVLLRTATGILHLYDRPRVRLFVWRDAFDRFLTVLCFVPRERYQADTARRAADILAAAWGGRVSACHPRSAEEPLARVHVVIGLDPGDHPDPDIPALEAEIAESLRTWTDRFEAAVRAVWPSSQVGELLHRYGPAFPPGYRDRYDAAETLSDLAVLEPLRQETGRAIRVRPYRLPEDPPHQFRFKLYTTEGAAPLSDVLPIVEHMGLRALEEGDFRLSPADGTRPWIHDYLLEDARGRPLDIAEMGGAFEAAFIAVWTGRTENDGFNRLVLELGVPWREAALIRALARWRQQTGLDPSQTAQESALRDHPGVARLILDLFRIKFDPAIAASVKERRQQADALYAEIEAALQTVASLDDDRVLRRLAQAVRAMTRTNYYQTGPDEEPKPYISFKIASREVEALPAPKPFREIFVASGQVDGVHLRFGPVARGGLRWSDRRDDFRTEVLSLVRTQQVKNAVIVPVGSKGGFYPKRLPREGGPDAVRAEAVEAYKSFLSGVLDLTDNLDAAGKVLHPPAVVAHDADDPYLVVAADKGTATFSDIANGLAQSYGFWLGDAFASGGSAGYDHKVMGITARGAWEAAKRHFRELGKDIQTEPFTAIGVGDMSGDVFGNGMLLSKATRLVAAFDHRHVFLDPDPDPEASWKERKRLFVLPRSSWADYDSALISKGGGVFPRTAKEIALTPEMKALLGVEADSLAPTDLIRAVLCAPAEMLYLGGIGTYVKAPSESHADVSDKGNDAVRIDAGELKVKVVVEGANLGFTQAGRIAFARAGGRINTDAIDNSAGVDTSDHEVNIKILTGQAIASGALAEADRDALLQGMTEEIAAHVLAHNYAQTLALSLAEATTVADLDAYGRFMEALVAEGRLDRKVEGLPGPVALAELKTQGKGLTRPELAVVLAYAKLELSAEIVGGNGPDDPYFEELLKGYFPAALAPFDGEMVRHRLRREIISTVLANAMVDMTGPTFPSRVQAATGTDAAGLVRAFETARRIFRLNTLWRSVSELDLKVPAAVQIELYQEVAQHLRAQTYWLLTSSAASQASVEALIEAYRPAVDVLAEAGPALLSDYDRHAIEAREKSFVEAGAPPKVARTVARLAGLRTAIEIADLARNIGWPPEAASRLYHTVGAAFGFDRLRGAASTLPAADDFERRALRHLVVELMGEQTSITREVMRSVKETAGENARAARTAVQAWSETRKAAVDRALTTVAELDKAGETWSFAKLTLAHSALRGLGA